MVAIHPIETPIRVDKDGVLRVGQTRVLIDLVVYAYEQGSTPEEIVLQYDTLKLSDVYGAIAYYLSHPEEIAAYIAKREQTAQVVRAKFDRNDYAEIRQRLLARRAQMHPTQSV
jgi:uncharacterized protein (DUF433 family)